MHTTYSIGKSALLFAFFALLTFIGKANNFSKWTAYHNNGEKFNYALGLMIGDNFSKNLGLNSKNFNVNEFCKSVETSLNSNDKKLITEASTSFANEAQTIATAKSENKTAPELSKDFAKNAGLYFGNAFKNAGMSSKDFNSAEFQQGLLSGMGELLPEIEMSRADEILKTEFESFRVQIGKKNAAAGKQFLIDNKKKNKKIKTTASGIQYLIIKKGKGPKPGPKDKVLTHYHGTHIDGSVFDSSVDRGEPIEFPLNGVIEGWSEILQLMPKGSKWKVYIPSNLAYGEQGSQGGIGPNETLIFEIELFKINGI